MGVLNRTPDSFSDGGQFLDERLALEHALGMLAEGASIIDVGAESTRPRAPRIDDDEQLRRIGSIVKTLAAEGVTVSIDTTSPAVAARALDDGAVLVNSVELGPARALAEVAKARGAALSLMHSRGAMSTMADFSVEALQYGDVVEDVKTELAAARDEAIAAGLAPEDLWLDPGLGFHKSARESLELCARLEEIVALGHTVLVGPSRKSFLAATTRRTPSDDLAPPDRRLGATIAACLVCAGKGASVLRVHDCEEVRQALAFEGAVRHA
jgi:dihydropteroate synthase